MAPQNPMLPDRAIRGREVRNRAFLDLTSECKIELRMPASKQQQRGPSPLHDQIHNWPGEHKHWNISRISCGKCPQRRAKKPFFLVLMLGRGEAVAARKRALCCILSSKMEVSPLASVISRFKPGNPHARKTDTAGTVSEGLRGWPTGGGLPERQSGMSNGGRDLFPSTSAKVWSAS